MSQLDRIVGGTISADTTTTSRPGFGVPMFMVYHAKNTDLFRDYTDLTGMTSDGFALYDPAYRMAASAFKQSPRPVKVRIGRILTAVADVKKLTVKDATVGKIVGVTITDAAGVAHVISRTNVGGDTTATIATALGALIAAISGVASATVTGSDIVVTITATGAVWYYGALSNLDILDQAADAGIDTAITGIYNVDQDFYGIAISVESKANIDKVQSWAETNKKLFVAHSADSVEAESGASVIGVELSALKLTHTGGLWSDDTIDYPACAWLGLMLPKDPGSATYALKQLTGVLPSALTTTQITALEAAGWNYYISIASRGVTRKDGTVFSGEKFDIIVGTDWLDSEIKADVFALLAKADKVDYDDAGVSKIKSVIAGKLDVAVERGFLEAGNGDDVPFPFVTAPRVSTIDPTSRANRLLPDVKFGGQLRGAIHSISYQGTLSV